MPMLHAFPTSFHLPPPDPLDDPQRPPLPPQPDDRPPPTLPEAKKRSRTWQPRACSGATRTKT